MKFKVNKREKKQMPETGYPEESYKIAHKFAKKLYEEFGDFLKVVVLFGSVVKNKRTKKPDDIDILVVIDDVSVVFNEEMTMTYRIIVEKLVADIDKERLHIQSMRYSTFWEYLRTGDPVAVNILRWGVALIDTGIFDPLQLLLEQGRIRPTPEAIQTYFHMAPASLGRAKQHLLSATVDLYWGVIDSAHAGLMKYGKIPPSPEHVAKMMEETLIKEKIISEKSAKTMRLFYKLFKDIVNRKIPEISGKKYDQYNKKAKEFINEIKKYIEK